MGFRKIKILHISIKIIFNTYFKAFKLNARFGYGLRIFSIFFAPSKIVLPISLTSSSNRLATVDSVTEKISLPVFTTQ